MFARLIESKRVRDRIGGGTVASIVGHAVILGGCIWASLGAKPSERIYTPPPTIVWSQVIPKPVHVWQGIRQPPGCAANCSALPVQLEIPETPVIGETFEPVLGSPCAASCPKEPGPRLPDAASDTGVYETTDQPAVPSRGNTRPDYPSILRNGGVIGVVTARFVVDSAGRVEPASITIENAGEALFEASVRKALLSWRFIPATANGHRVRMLVTEDFNFRLTP